MSTIKNLKEQMEQFEVAMKATLATLFERITAIELAGSKTDGEIGKDKDEILAKIEKTGNDISASNVATANAIKEDIVAIKEVVIKNLLAENQKLKKRLSSLEKRAIDTERKLNLMDQHSRKVNMEIDGIPQTIQQTELKNFVGKMFEHAGITPISNNDIEVIHRLKSKKSPQTVILKAKRDFLDKVYEKKK